MKKDIKSMLPKELEDSFISFGEKSYRAKQVFSWLHKGVLSFDDMTDLSLGLREKLSEEFFISKLNLLKKQVSSDGTIKYLYESSNGAMCEMLFEVEETHRVTDRVFECSSCLGLSVTVAGGALDIKEHIKHSVYDDSFESVLLDYKHGKTICISTQVGCKMGCVFCASSMTGFVRNLTASEMLDQVLFSGEEAGVIISNIVLMGMGEPLDNFDNVVRFIELAREPKGLNIGARHITLSTCGLPEHIDRLAQYGVQLSLAISLHAPDDETRSMLMPSNLSTGIKAILEASDRYSKKTNRRITYEYALIDGINDTSQHAQKLAKLLKNTGCHLNLIQLSKVNETGFLPSSKSKIDKFAEILIDSGISLSTRRSLGADIDAACGQLRRRNVVNGIMGCD